MLTDLFTKKVKTDTATLVTCPLCAEEYAMHIYPGDIWRCVSCNRTGDAETLKELMGDDLMILADNLKKPKPPEGLIVVSEHVPKKNVKSLSTGFNPLDRTLGGLEVGKLTVITGKRGQGKSTFSGQVALSIINDGGGVCFYSGELTADNFRRWVLNQAAGPQFIEPFLDRYGAERYSVDSWAEQRILSWLGNKLILYDNSIVKSSERNSILDRFTLAKRYYNCDVFFVDNLMTARIPIDQERDFYRAQSNFVRDLAEFAIVNDAHVILVAHPRKSVGNDWNDAVAGTGDITNIASNVIAVTKLDETADHDADIEVTKGREHGDEGAIAFNFDKRSRRFVLTSGKQIERYGWEDEV